MIARLRRASQAQGGFTMVEVLVAMALAVVLIGALSVLFVNGNDSALAGQRQSEAIAVADQQIEHIRQLVKSSSNGFSSLAMTSAPAAGTATTLSGLPNAHTDPNYFVNTTSHCGPNSAGYTIETNYDNSSEPLPATVPAFSNCPAGVEPLVISSTLGVVAPATISVPVGSGTATVYAYVTATNLGCSPGSGDYVFPTAGSCYADARRLTVAVLLDTGGGRRTIGQSTPIYVSTIISNPVPSNQTNTATGITLGLHIL